jgi:DNA-binding CsgD family transcriptional regulator
MMGVELNLVRHLCDVAVKVSSVVEYRTHVLDALRLHLAFDAALFHELSPRVSLSRAAVWGLEPGAIDANRASWDETAVRLQPLLEVALAQGGAATDSEAFPRGSRSRREWEQRIAKPLGIQSLLVGHLLRHGRVISAVILMRRRKGFTRAERIWLAELLPCLTLGDAYWQFAGKRRFDGMLAQPVCRDQRLTARQREIVEGVALGRTNLQIAEGLGISPHTVRNILVEVCARLGAGNRADVVRLAVLSAP